ncbi:MAG: cobalamin-dependent protein, partial [Planctomycetes bacterium]|nr:cobalamin-dependent protein [Planctomycetota bacterium]
YGAAIIVLPVGEGLIPETAAERLRIVDRILAEAAKYGITANDVLVDGLAMTVSADPAAGHATLETIRRCGERGLATILGLSNVSFGMPERKWLNALFLGMGMAAGLAAVIANPSAELLMEAKTSADALLDRYDGPAAYLGRFGKKKALTPQPAVEAVPAAASPAERAAQAVLKGAIKRAAPLAREAVAAGVAASRLVADHLVPAIMTAGDLYEKQEYYLPQLMLAGEAMRLALAEVEPDLAAERQGGGEQESRGRIVMATVKGDVHDIGKNLVSLMLRNHGYEVIDLGKDVPPETVIQAIREYSPGVVGLSALMTTTLAAMRETIEAVRAAGLGVKFMVGGAAVTEHFAAEAGADGYSADAVAAVKLAGELLEKQA